jgi:hypothetical protein
MIDGIPNRPLIYPSYIQILPCRYIPFNLPLKRLNFPQRLQVVRERDCGEGSSGAIIERDLRASPVENGDLRGFIWDLYGIYMGYLGFIWDSWDLYGIFWIYMGI